MTVITFKHVARLTPILAAFVIVLGASQPASAATCAQDLGSCYQQAAGAGGYWAQLSSALDCDASYAQCVVQGLAF